MIRGHRCCHRACPIRRHPGPVAGVAIRRSRRCQLPLHFLGPVVLPPPERAAQLLRGQGQTGRQEGADCRTGARGRGRVDCCRIPSGHREALDGAPPTTLYTVYDSRLQSPAGEVFPTRCILLLHNESLNQKADYSIPLLPSVAPRVQNRPRPSTCLTSATRGST